MVITGKEKSKTGKVLQMLPKKDGVIVEGLNIVKRHTKARGNEPGGIWRRKRLSTSPMSMYCSKCSKPVRTRNSALEDGKKARICVKCGEAFDK